MKKILRILTLIILIIMLLGCSVEAVNTNMNVAKNFTQHGQSSIISMKGLYYVVNFLYGVALTIAISLEVIRGAIIALTIVWGSIEDKANAKQMLMNYAFQVAVLALIVTLLQSGINVMKNKWG